MADKAISDLTEALQILSSDWFVLQQGNEAKKLNGNTLKQYLAQIEVNSIESVTFDAQGRCHIILTDGTEIISQPLKGADGIDGTDGEDAPTITNIAIDANYHLIITLSDGTSYDAGYCRGASGAGTGDMLAEVYDPNGEVSTAGGIPAFVSEHGGGMKLMRRASEDDEWEPVDPSEDPQEGYEYALRQQNGDISYVFGYELAKSFVMRDEYSPSAKTSEMTQEVGKDAAGKLWTNPAQKVTATEYSFDRSANLTGSAGVEVDVYSNGLVVLRLFRTLTTTIVMTENVYAEICNHEGNPFGLTINEMVSVGFGFYVTASGGSSAAYITAVYDGSYTRMYVTGTASALAGAAIMCSSSMIAT